MINKKIILTPSQYYRNLRPEFFSDSKIRTSVVLPKEQLDYEINQLAINQKHDNFETLCRKLAEKLITPNLIPQVGPTGGGDGKTDSETYPVSSFISERWFISDNKWNENENWAFAISAKADWKAKVKADVKKIIGTNRGYTKIFFFSNQKISSRNKKDIQDQLKINFNIEVIVLDAEWIVDKIFSNSLLNDAIECLNMSTVYKEEKIIGNIDAKRMAALIEIEKNINSTNRSFEVDFQLVENCLESAILSRMLELPKTEIIGKFERAKNFAKKTGNTQQVIRIIYQLAWTYINWYDDYDLFYKEFQDFKLLTFNEPNLDNLESYLNLINVLKAISIYIENSDAPLINFLKEEDDFITLLTRCSLKKEKPSTALLSKFYLSFITISRKLTDRADLSEEIVNLKNYFEKSKDHMDLPFEQLRQVIDLYSEILAESNEFDNLVDTIAELESTRVSELSAGQIYMDRGTIKLEKNLNKESLVYFGKAVRKLAKKETQTEFYYCLMLLSEAYSKLGLFWAANNCLVAAINIYANEWYTTGKINPRFLNGVTEILENEVILGRVPVVLSWFELFTVLSTHFPEEEAQDNEEISAKNLIDGCLSTRLLNISFPEYKKLIYLPDILEHNQLFLSSSSTLYLLGQEESIDLELTEKKLSKEKLTVFFSSVANQPFKNQMAYETNFLDNSDIELRTRILGIELIFSFDQETNLLILCETILAYLESYLATAFKDVFPLTDKVTIKIKYSKLNNFFNLQSDIPTSLVLYIRQDFDYKSTDFLNLIEELLPHIISKNYLIKDIKSFVEKLYKHDEVNERLSIIVEHKTFLTNILTSRPKFFLDNWKTEYTKKNPLIRNSSIDHITDREINLDESDSKTKQSGYDNITHQNFKSATIIDVHLWDKAKWKGFGFYFDESVPFGIFLAFENKEFGKKIFENWIIDYGKTDVNNLISLTIIKGIDKQNPHWYRILVSRNFPKEFNQRFLSLGVRIHTVQPKDNINLNNIINGFDHFQKYLFTPAYIDKNLKLNPFPDLGLLKTELKVINAWEIGIGSFESSGILPNDRPIIPAEIENAPVLAVLNRFNQ